MTTTTVAPPAPVTPHDEVRSTSLEQCALAFDRLALRQGGGAPIGDVDVYGRALAHPDLKPEEIRHYVRQLGVGLRNGQFVTARRATFALLFGADAKPCAECIGRKYLRLDLVGRVGECSAHEAVA